MVCPRRIVHQVLRHIDACGTISCDKNRSVCTSAMAHSLSDVDEQFVICIPSTLVHSVEQ